MNCSSLFVGLVIGAIGGILIYKRRTSQTPAPAPAPTLNPAIVALGLVANASNKGFPTYQMAAQLGVDQGTKDNIMDPLLTGDRSPVVIAAGSNGPDRYFLRYIHAPKTINPTTSVLDEFDLRYIVIGLLHIAGRDGIAPNELDQMTKHTATMPRVIWNLVYDTNPLVVLSTPLPGTPTRYYLANYAPTGAGTDNSTES